MPRDQSTLIQKKLINLAIDPYSQNNNATKLRNRDGYRLRIGDWRVIYEIVDDKLVILVMKIASRGDIYR